MEAHGYPPTYDAAGKKLWLTPSGVFFHIKKLRAKGYFDLGEQTKYLERTPDVVKIPVIWRVACGEPIEVNEDIITYVQISTNVMKNSGWLYGLIAQWNSMRDVGIDDWDYLIIRPQTDVVDGDIAVVIDQSEWEEKATLKRVYHKPSSLMLKPENHEFPTVFWKQCDIRGKLVNVIKQFEKN